MDLTETRIIENLADCVSVLGPDGTIRYVSPAGEALFGAPPEDLVGQSMYELAELSGETAIRDDAAPERALGPSTLTRYHLRRADGRRLLVETTARPRLAADGSVEEIHCVTRDVSDREAAIKRRESSGDATRFESAFANAPIGVALIDPERGFVRVNASLVALMGRREAELLGASPLAYAHPDDVDRLSAAIDEVDSGRVPSVTVEYRIVRDDATIVWVNRSVAVVRDDDGRLLYRVAHFEDITARRLAEEEQRAATRRFETAFADAPIGMALVGLDGAWLRVNRTLCTVTGYTELELLALTFQDLTHPDDLDADLEQVQALLDGESEHYTMEKRYFTKSGDLVWGMLAVSLVRDADGNPLHFISHIEDITERKRLEATLHRLADHDALTELWNRRRFEEELARQLSRCQRYGERAALVVLDLDGFKPVNDRHGHKAGDDLLRAVAAALSSRVRSSDTLARLGGDEFAVLLPGVGPDQAADVAEKLRDAVAGARIVVDGREVGVTASVGVEVVDGDGDGDGASGDEAFVAADRAMYADKARSPRRWSSGDHSDEAVTAMLVAMVNPEPRERRAG